MVWFTAEWKTVPNEDCRLNKLVIDISKAELKPFESTVECVVDAVLEITKKYPPPYTLLASGGVDSQAMIHAWKLSGIPFRIVHYNYHGLNDHDTQFLITYCNKNNLNFEIRDFNALEFITSKKLITYAKKYDCSSPQILTYIRFTEKHDETVIMSGNVFDGLLIGVNYTILALDRYSNINKKNVVPFFFCSTPSITYLTKYHKNKLKYKINLDLNAKYQHKINLYNSFGANIIEQSKPYTGFEQIKEILKNSNTARSLKYKYKDKPSKNPFDLNYRYNLYDYIGLYSESTEILRIKD